MRWLGGEEVESSEDRGWGAAPKTAVWGGSKVPCEGEAFRQRPCTGGFELTSWVGADREVWERKLEPLAGLEGLDCGKGQHVDSLGTVNEGAACGHVSQGLFLRDPNGSQMEGRGEAGRQGGQQECWEVTPV